MVEFSGAQWCARFPTSKALTDLVEPFRTSATHWIAGLEAAGAEVEISATYRPEERAYLMHWCCQIAGYRDKAGVFHQVAPADVPPMVGVDIDWTHGGDLGAARAAAVAMREAYGIVYPAALDSRHIEGNAVDMTITWRETIIVKDASGLEHACWEQAQLYPIGATYGAHKLLSDPPHWSSDGH